MDNQFVPPVSIEEFAAYLDNNLSMSEMNEMEDIISNHPEMGELMSMSDIVDEDIHCYIQDDFAYNADITALEDGNLDIPDLENAFVPEGDSDMTHIYSATPAAAADIPNEQTSPQFIPDIVSPEIDDTEVILEDKDMHDDISHELLYTTPDNPDVDILTLGNHFFE